MDASDIIGAKLKRGNMAISISTRAARIWEPVRRFLEAMDGIDDPQGEYLFRLETRVQNLEAELARLRGSEAPPGASTSAY